MAVVHSLINMLGDKRNVKICGHYGFFIEAFIGELGFGVFSHFASHYLSRYLILVQSVWYYSSQSQEVSIYIQRNANNQIL